MRSRGPRKMDLTPVDDDPRAPLVDHPSRERFEALFDQNLFRLQIKRERSAAFWMAASIWGVSGLVLGSCLGAIMMFYAYTGMTPTVRDNLMAGAAMDAARDTVDNRPSLVDPER